LDSSIHIHNPHEVALSLKILFQKAELK